MLTMIDMDMGNLQSVREAFRRVGAPVTVTNAAADVERAAAIVLPGVGAFGDGMERLRSRGLVEPLRAHARAGKPFLGICVGMQLLADEGEEHGRHDGLGLVRGRCVRLKPGGGDRVPNMGWCDVRVVKDGSVLLAEAPDGEPFYFAHSYHLECRQPDDVAATIEYGGNQVVVAVERDNLFGVQFHPEKSQDGGLAVLQAFWRLVERG
jgi:glutamine amidotransferase